MDVEEEAAGADGVEAAVVAEVFEPAVDGFFAELADLVLPEVDEAHLRDAFGGRGVVLEDVFAELFFGDGLVEALVEAFELDEAELAVQQHVELAEDVDYRRAQRVGDVAHAVDERDRAGRDVAGLLQGTAGGAR